MDHASLPAAAAAAAALAAATQPAAAAAAIAIAARRRCWPPAGRGDGRRRLHWQPRRRGACGPPFDRACKKCPLCAQTPSQTSSHLPQPLFTPIQKELFYIEFIFPIWTPPPVNIGGSIGFSASFGVSMGGRACITDRRVEVVLTPEASLEVRASREPPRRGCVPPHRRRAARR